MDGRSTPKPSARGFDAVRSPGRLGLTQRRDEAPVLLDGAHNPDGARTLATTLREDFAFERRVFGLFTMNRGGRVG